MAILYPLVIPAPVTISTDPVSPCSADLKQFDGVGEFISPFDGSAEQQSFQDQHWELDLEWPPMNWAQFAALQAFTGALHGKQGSFLWGPPLATQPLGLGTLAGNPVCTGADFEESNQLHTAGWLPNQFHCLLPGDFFSLSGAGSGVQTYPFTSIARAAGLVTAYVPAVGASWALVPYVGLTLYLQNGNDFDGTFEITQVVPVFFNDHGRVILEAYNVSWSQGGANETLGAGNASTMLVATRLYQYVTPTPLASDSGGNATLDIFPSIRESPTNGQVVILSNPQGTFRLAENRRASPAKKNKTFTLALKCREAI